MRILLVEDEPHLQEAIAFLLKKQNYLVDTADNGVDGQDMAESGLYDLIILDRMLPGKEGLEILKYLRASGMKTPVLFLTAKDAVSDRVAGLDGGADDYLVKPFSKDELLARVRALSRRQTEVLPQNTLSHGNLELDPLKCEVTCGSVTVRLTAKESQILELLLRNKNLAVTKEQLLDRIWGLETEVESNNLEVYISFLRKKLSGAGSNVVIETLRGVGYTISGSK